MSAQHDDLTPVNEFVEAGETEPAPSLSVASSAVAPDPVEAPAAHARVPLLNVANVLTVVRILIVPVFLAALFAGGGDDTGWRIVATLLFGIAAVTDRIDGQLARKYGLVTDFGKLADPIADKLLIGAALIGLSMLGDLAWWVTGVIAAREIGVTLLRFAVLRHGVIPASRGGKLKTLVQSLAIALYLLPLPDAAHIVAVWVMGFAVVLTVITGLDYVVQSIRLRAVGRRRTGSAA
ncbi:CDP-diacylglycerol--glycerol-3-phosphate 3-phosphatidyltransferase [Aldersonia sp. NBC_00410]|uniref:CDP-diacylglycerol--glycerol-3-phosphate 3-phosphatidyltransferase n=1 Tax=Aldersonia sp. NBC_00410 TaxID=2975954 RepID=UPI0022585E5C|nr:CDP-diacylglycerol--glycerol-3-phosphate 3-phosphatidyltransferase [Aldersonia sp. NBC_00410]MCX5045894.1 CDP-diacylglycerol--glycerol-3-phosphate 3-phosphatidyltransferase [Aldersonia sp. NBC_00410]